MTSIAVVVITDGRVELLADTLESFEANVTGPVTERFIYDDSGRDEVRFHIRRTHPAYRLIQHPTGKRQGFAGAIRTAWNGLRAFSTADLIFHLEDDFTFNRPVDLRDFVAVLDHRPRLAQLAMLRQPWNDEEEAAGGVIQQHPDWYTGHVDRDGRHWVEQDQFFTTNPSLYRRALLDMEWPNVPHSEGVFSIGLRKEGWSFGFWGTIHDPPLVHHHGAHRVGTGY